MNLDDVHHGGGTGGRAIAARAFGAHAAPRVIDRADIRDTLRRHYAASPEPGRHHETAPSSTVDALVHGMSEGDFRRTRNSFRHDVAAMIQDDDS